MNPKHIPVLLRMQAIKEIRMIDAQLRLNEENWVPPGWEPPLSVDPEADKYAAERKKDLFFGTQRLLRQLRNAAFERVRS